MPRFSRESIKTNIFHVMTQGINKMYIFDRPEEIKYYIKLMYELLKEHKVKIIAYCIMNNHTHMLIRTENIDELSNYMHRLNIRYAMYYNRKHNRVGYVFRDRFKTEGIYSEKQLYNCIKYIYDNPVKAGICAKPEQYPYSNYKKIPDIIIDNSYTFIDVEEEKEQVYLEEIQEFLKNKNINLEQLKKNETELGKLIKILKDKHNISLRKVSEVLNIKREKTRELYNKNK